ncbi:MAG: hypothetical protein KHZ79_06190 [Atopobium minutum]|uniref:FCS-type domain-containing protein n=2 Tax=Atopobium TaxID=1380 RepID=A0AB38A5K7_9ACTN|nr:hypothetical protein [Atopobium minutum]MBS4873944.1 hypothetical protein [Atopobium minutum]SEB43856.1 hypothetical protein SAMN04489746_0223 [Atopobium minutum]
MIKHCEVCGREFTAQRKTAKYCSNKCRLMSQRGVPYIGELQPPAATAIMTAAEVQSTVQQAHIVASDLSRASMMTYSPLCLKLRRVAKKLEDALRGEGL